MSSPRIDSIPPAASSASRRSQHAAAGRRRDGARRPVHPGEGIEHLEEEDEGGDQGALRRIGAGELGHAGIEDEPLGRGLRHQPASPSRAHRRYRHRSAAGNPPAPAGPAHDRCPAAAPRACRSSPRAAAGRREPSDAPRRPAPPRPGAPSRPCRRCSDRPPARRRAGRRNPGPAKRRWRLPTTSASSRAGITAVTAGAPLSGSLGTTGGSRSAARQKPPRASSR